MYQLLQFTGVGSAVFLWGNSEAFSKSQITYTKKKIREKIKSESIVLYVFWCKLII